LEKSILVKKIIVDALIEGYRKQAEYQQIDADELIERNRQGAEAFASDLASKIMLVVSN
jgi:hypothetical protein